ncbi:nitroreductase family protein [Paraclostridium sordellii]|uniref:nitroreductase family protein n=1 Tax=Paraclostridium sordellii TaxID=1505 RepID=UPI0003864DA9|nr:nitroreductase family protein [[Clostridium] sordellii VPI 9048] [Paeniclostridium sordellii VPI 9048]EPZ62061.1 nitroreductase family protein [[Clostridium] sordellii VPI 9048] [Paeniclostridium sordellii VPI 9048]
MPLEIIHQTIEVGRFIPSAKNSQDVSCIVLDESKSKYEKIAGKFFRRIKLIISFFMKSAKEVTIYDNFFSNRHLLQ